MLDEDVLHRLPADGTDAELFQFAKDPGVPPTGLFRDQDNQFPHDGRQPWPAFTSGAFAFFFTNPTTECGVTDDRDQMANGRPQLLAQLQQLRPFVRAENDVLLRHPLAKHFVFHLEELDLLLEVVGGRAGEQEEEWLEKLAHRDMILELPCRTEKWQSFCTPLGVAAKAAKATLKTEVDLQLTAFMGLARCAGW